jgi:hypothetical protein
MSGNGSSRYTVVESRQFTAHRLVLQDRWPRLGEVFGAVKQQFSAIPRYRASKLSGSTWLYKTKRGSDVPSVWIFYEIEAQEVRLRAALAEGRETLIL